MPGIPLLDINNLSDVSDTATARDNLDIYSKIEITDRLSSSEVDLGDALLGVKKNFTGSIYRTQHDVNNETASIYDFGGLENADNHDALLKAISSGVGRIYIPTGVFPYSGTIDFGGRVIFGDGPNKSQLLAIDDTAIIKIGSGGHLSDLMINGNGSSAATGVGSYGLILPFAQSMLVDNVQVRYFNKYGIILDKSQNSQLIKCNAQYNAVNYLLNNGARNMVISSCNAALSIDEANGRVSSHRNVLITSITDDNVLSSTSIGQSNSRILIIGGIFEYGNYAQYNIEILHAGRLQQDILMVDVEVTSGEPLLENQYLINLDYGSLGLINPQLNGPDSGKTVRIGEKGRLYVPTDDSFGTSGRGKSPPSNGITVLNGGAL